MRRTRPDRRTSPPPSRRASDGGLLRFLLTAGAARLGVPQLRRRAVQHPVGLDAADALHRRLSARRQMALRLFALQLPVRIPVVRRPDLRASCPKRGDVVVFRQPGGDIDFIKRVIGLPGDTVEVRGGDADPQRPPAAARRRCGRSPCRSAPTARARWCRRRARSSPASATGATTASTPPIARRCRAGPATPCSTRSTIRAPTISRRSKCPPAMSS